jgi:glycosyltransferase involved in cell wall biosynthesis
VRLLVLLPSRARGGAEDYALTVARGALAAGWDTHAALPFCAGTATVQQEFTDTGIPLHALDLDEEDLGGREYGLRNTRRHLHNAWRTMRVLRAVRPDVLHVVLPWPTFCYGSQAVLAALRYGAVITFQLVPEGMSISSGQRRAYALFRRRGQKWVAISDFSRRLILEMFGAERSEIALIPNGVRLGGDAEPGESRDDVRASVRRELGLAPSTRIALTVARLVEQKGHSVLVPAINSVVRAHPEVRFVWVGDGDQLPLLKAAVGTAGAADHVIMTGMRRDVPRLMAASDLFVFPTRYEGLPFTVLEAMAAGLPIVASDAASIPEIIQPGRHGVLFPSGDSRALEAALLESLQNPERSSQMAACARERVREFSEEQMVRGTLALLESAVLDARRGVR